jgi:predicted dehydrogenase
MLLPHLAKHPEVELARVATRRSLSAVNAQRKFGFAASGTDADAVIEDPSLDAVFIVTRHSSHAELACRALEAGKAVFVEKPLALSGEELDRVLATVDATDNDRILVGFNRRYAPLLVEMRARFGESSEPTNARYLVNAGRLAPDSWYRDSNVQGSRFVGEGGHFVDTLSWWIGSDPVEVVTMPAAGPDELQMSLRYDDGSLATITYLTNAHRRFPKETFEASRGGRTARLDNFKRTTVWSGARARVRRPLGSPDKGQSAQIDEFLRAVRSGGPMPISLESLATTTRATLAASSAGTGCTTTRL